MVNNCAFYYTKFRAVLNAQADLTIKGKILGYDGNPMTQAFYSIENWVTQLKGSRLPMIAKPDGSFEIKITENGSYNLIFGGLCHTSSNLSFPVSGQKGTVEMEVQLAANKISLYPYSLWIKSNAEDDFYSLKFLSVSPDGKFRYRVDKAMDTLLLQIGAKQYYVSSAFPYPGAEYVVDSIGGYYTQFTNVKPGFTVDIDPTSLPRPTGENSNKVKILSDNAGYTDVFNLANSLDFSYRKALTESYPYFLHLYNETSDAKVKDIAAIKLLESNLMLEMPFIPDPVGVAKSVLPESPGWDMNFYSTSDVFEYLSPEERPAYIHKVFDSHTVLTKYTMLNQFKSMPHICSPELYGELYKKLAVLTDEIKAADLNITELDPGYSPLNNEKLHDFTVKLIDGKVFSPSQLKGKYFLIDFWGTWCMPCIAAIPELEKAYEKFHPKGFEIISLALESTPEDFNELRKEHKMPWLHAILTEKETENIINLYQIMYIPKMLLISPEGEVIGNEETLGNGGLTKKLEEIFKN